MTAQPGELQGRHVLLIVAGFFGTVIAANAAFIFAAVKTFPGEEVQHAYAAGLEYNAEVAERHRQQALGWRARLSIARSGEDVTLTLRYSARDGEPVSGLKVTGEMRRLTHAGADRPLRFEPREPGVYAARVVSAGRGLWDIRARAVGAAPGEVFDLESRVTAP